MWRTGKNNSIEIHYEDLAPHFPKLTPSDWEGLKASLNTILREALAFYEGDK